MGKWGTGVEEAFSLGSYIARIFNFETQEGAETSSLKRYVEVLTPLPECQNVTLFGTKVIAESIIYIKMRSSWRRGSPNLIGLVSL